MSVLSLAHPAQRSMRDRMSITGISLACGPTGALVVHRVVAGHELRAGEVVEQQAGQRRPVVVLGERLDQAPTEARGHGGPDQAGQTRVGRIRRELEQPVGGGVDTGRQVDRGLARHLAVRVGRQVAGPGVDRRTVSGARGRTVSMFDVRRTDPGGRVGVTMSGDAGAEGRLVEIHRRQATRRLPNLTRVSDQGRDQAGDQAGIRPGIRRSGRRPGSTGGPWRSTRWRPCR